MPSCPWRRPRASICSAAIRTRKSLRTDSFVRPANTANSALGIFPDGYVPVLPGESIDYSAALGVKGEIFTDWNYDLSASVGENYLDLSASNTVNPSLGDASPTEHYIGRTTFNQRIAELNVSRYFDQAGPLESLNLAFGAQARRDNFEVEQGSLGSYQVGPLAISGKAVGSSARPGIAPADEIDLSRTNVGLYVDVESDITASLLLATALRYEHYSDFGDNLSGKFAARYKLNDTFALRGSYNRGFRAPSLAQLGNRVNTSTVQNGVIIITKQVSSDDPRLAQLGVPEPEAEISDNYNLGITADLGDFCGRQRAGHARCVPDRHRRPYRDHRSHHHECVPRRACAVPGDRRDPLLHEPDRHAHARRRSRHDLSHELRQTACCSMSVSPAVTPRPRS